MSKGGDKVRIHRLPVVGLLVMCGLVAAASSWGQTVTRPGARLAMTKSVALSTNGTPTVVVFDAAVFDTGGFWTAAAGHDVLKVPAGLAGLYLATAGVLVKGGLVGTGLWMDVRTGPEFFQVCGQSGQFYSLGFTPTIAVLSCAGVVNLAEGQTVHLTAYGMGGAGAAIGPTASPLVGGSIDLTYLSLVKLD